MPLSVVIMKKIIFLSAIVVLVSTAATAQCEVFGVPYFQNFDNVTTPALPACYDTTPITFGSQEVWETAQDPWGSTGNVASFDTWVANSGNEMPTGAEIWGPPIQLTAGESYTLSFKHGLSSFGTITELYVSLSGFGVGNIPIGPVSTSNGLAQTYSQVITAPATGAYQLGFSTMTGSNQGLIYIDDILLQPTSTMGVQETSLKGLTVSPNPVRDVVQISHSAAIDKIEMYTVAGKLIETTVSNAPVTNLQLGHLQSGIYFARITAGDKQKTIKLIKQ